MSGAASLICAVLLCALAARPAHAQEPSSTYRAVLDRADLEPASVGGFRLRVYVSALSLDGQLLDLTEPKSIKMLSGRSELRAPYALGNFAASQTDLAMVFIVQATTEYADVMRAITEAADTGLLEHLSEPRTQVAILTYGEAVSAGKLGSLKTARSKIRQLSSEGAAAEPVLLDALDRALRLLKSAKTEPEGRPLRKLVVVISDGRDRSNDRDRVTALGKRAAAANVRVHTFAHAPTDVRRPLLLLGELSKRSFGTFRWLRKDATTAAQWQTRFLQLRDEIKQQYVLTYFVDDDSVGGRELKLTTTGRTVLASLNELRVPQASCNGETCEPGAYCADRCIAPRQEGSRGILGWLFLIVGIAVGGILLLGGIGFVYAKLQATRVKAPEGMRPTGAHGIPLPPGSHPPGPGSHPPVHGSHPPVHGSQQPAPGSHPPAYGSQQPRATAGFQSHAPPPAGPVTSARLYIMSGARQGETLALRHGFAIGAAPNNDLVIADGFASTHHAQIGVDPQGNCWISDLGSTNGTFINGVRVTQKPLDHGVTVRIGSTEIRFLAQ